MKYEEDKYECLDCDHVFTRTDSDEYQIITNHVLDDDLPDSDTVCPKCGSDFLDEWDTITLGDKIQQVAINLAGGAIIAVVVWVALVGIFAVDALVGGAK